MTRSDTLEVGSLVRVHVRGVTSGGAGVADLPDGRVAFVHRTAPGDVAEVRIDKLRRRWGRASLVRLARPADGRVEAQCPHYGVCGGCSLQHLAYEDQLSWKARIVADALARLGGTEVEPPEVVPAPATTAYRNRMTFTVKRLRAGRTVAGLHALGRPGHVVDVEGGCVLPEPAILDAWTALRRAIGAGTDALPEAGTLRVTIRTVDGGVALVVEGGAQGWPGQRLAEVVPGAAAVWHRAKGQPRAERVAGSDCFETVDGTRVPIAGRAFLQVNHRAALGLVDHVVTLVGEGEGDGLVDAYCGVGVFGRRLAEAGWSVSGIEVDPDACAAARHEAPSAFEVVEGLVEERLKETLPASVVVVNPPRTGLHERVPEILATDPPARLVYVSCDPATLARDTSRMAQAFDLAGLRAFDLFPQTAHVETVALFERRKGA